LKNKMDNHHQHGLPQMKNKKLNIMKWVLPLIAMLVLLAGGCKQSTENEANEYEINSLYDSIRNAFAEHDIDAFLQKVHPQYLHNGMARLGLRELWLDRMAKYQLIDFQEIKIDLNEDEALVSFTLKLQSATETVYFPEPETHGDISYLLKTEQGWSIYGNQESSRCTLSR